MRLLVHACTGTMRAWRVGVAVFEVPSVRYAEGLDGLIAYEVFGDHSVDLCTLAVGPRRWTGFGTSVGRALLSPPRVLRSCRACGSPRDWPFGPALVALCGWRFWSVDRGGGERCHDRAGRDRFAADGDCVQRVRGCSWRVAGGDVPDRVSSLVLVDPVVRVPDGGGLSVGAVARGSSAGRRHLSCRVG